MKVRSLIALVVLVHAALFLAAAGPDKAAKSKNGSSTSSSTIVSPGFQRGG
jgi:hypothetical protein